MVCIVVSCFAIVFICSGVAKERFDRLENFVDCGFGGVSFADPCEERVAHWKRVVSSAIPLLNLPWEQW